MDHQWENELGTRIASVDVCRICGAMRFRPKHSPQQFVGKDAIAVPSSPPCRNEEARERPAAAEAR